MDPVEESEYQSWRQRRTLELGYSPQRENIYNQYLPYSEKLDEESSYQFSTIKGNLALSIQLSDIKFGTSHWLAQFSKYIQLYGLKFSKEDHLNLIHMMYDLITMPNLDYSYVLRVAGTLITLLKKKGLLTQDDLVLDWKPLYNLFFSINYTSKGLKGLGLLPENLDSQIRTLVIKSRVYFSAESSKEILEECRPYLCPFDSSMIQGVTLLSLFLPTAAPRHLDQYSIWFEEMMILWSSCPNYPSWGSQMQWLFARLSNDLLGHVDWSQYYSIIFAWILRALHLPVGDAIIISANAHDLSEIDAAAMWMVGLLGGENSAFSHMMKLFTLTQSFYHPSNQGKWTKRLLRLLSRVTDQFVRRIHRERYKKSWWGNVPSQQHIKEEEIDDFVQMMMPLCETAMFSKIGAQDTAMAMLALAQLRPQKVLPPLLEQTYPAMETVTEPHRLIACLHCLIHVVRPMLHSKDKFPRGNTHVMPLLMLSLPGIDSNDIHKCMTTFQLISALVSLCQMVDCTTASSSLPDLSKDDQEVCLATAQCEDFVLQFTDKVINLVENAAHNSNTQSVDNQTLLSLEETLLEAGLLSTLSVVMQQSSRPIYEVAVQKIFRFVSSSVLEHHVGGRLASDMCRAAAKVHPDYALKVFVPHFCLNILSRLTSDDLSQEEILDNDLLWNMKLLSEIVRVDGDALLVYREQLLAVLQKCLCLISQQGSELASTLLHNILRSMTLLHTMDHRSTTVDLGLPFSQNLPVHGWGASASLDTLNAHWHVPNIQELLFVEEVLEKFLVPQLARIDRHRMGKEIMTREQLRISLMIIRNCVAGASTVIYPYSSEVHKLIDCRVELGRFSNTASVLNKEVTVQQRNVRESIMQSIRPLAKSMLDEEVDDTKSLNEIIKIYNTVMFYYGMTRRDFDGKWKSLKLVKRAMRNRLIGKKCHMRAVLVDRLELQHELRALSVHSRTFTEFHSELLLDVLQLSLSRYSAVRKLAQSTLFKALDTFSYSYNVILPKIYAQLQDSPDVGHHQFKGALHIILRDKKKCLATCKNWSLMYNLWPALITAQHSEKPSIIKLIEEISGKIHKHLESTCISLRIDDSIRKSAGRVMSAETKPESKFPVASESDILAAAKAQEAVNAENLNLFNNLVHKLADHISSGDLRWRFLRIALEMLELMIRPDVVLPPKAVQTIVECLVSESLQIRKTAINALAGVLRQQKPSFVKIKFDPYEISGTSPSIPPRPGDRPDNRWMQYSSESLSEEAFNESPFVGKTHWGYYAWPKLMTRYAPIREQLPLTPSLSELRAEQVPIYQAFLDPEFVKKFIDFITLEESKGQDRFHLINFLLFKGLFRNYGEAHIANLRSHMERMVDEASPEKHEQYQRCCSELVAALVRGSKHWDYQMHQNLWSWLIPLTVKAMKNMSQESNADWGTAMATLSESQDPRRLQPLFEALMGAQLDCEVGSFEQASRLYLLQGALAQQEWRVSGLLCRLLDILRPHLAHVYKNVRDRIASVLVNILVFDLPIGSKEPLSPRRKDFMMSLLPQLHHLYHILIHQNSASGTAALLAVEDVRDEPNPVSIGDVEMKFVGEISTRNSLNSAAVEGASSLGQIMVEAASVSSDNLSINAVSHDEGVEESGDKKTRLIRLGKTVMQWLHGNFTRTKYNNLEQFYQLLPLICSLSHEANDPELQQLCHVSVLLLARGNLTSDLVPSVLDIVNQICASPIWHAREAILRFLQVLVFTNLYSFVEQPSQVELLKRIVLNLLQDCRVEVREKAATTLSGLMHCGFIGRDQEMLKELISYAGTSLGKKPVTLLSSAELTSRGSKMVKRHAGVLGLGAVIESCPYEITPLLPEALMIISRHVNDPQPIQASAKKILSNFRRTHHDNWLDHKAKFSEEQLAVLADVLISPNYYA